MKLHHQLYHSPTRELSFCQLWWTTKRFSLLKRDFSVLNFSSSVFIVFWFSKGSSPTKTWTPETRCQLSGWCFSLTLHHARLEARLHFPLQSQAQRNQRPTFPTRSGSSWPITTLGASWPIRRDQEEAFKGTGAKTKCFRQRLKRGAAATVWRKWYVFCFWTIRAWTY